MLVQPQIQHIRLRKRTNKQTKKNRTRTRYRLLTLLYQVADDVLALTAAFVVVVVQAAVWHVVTTCGAGDAHVGVRAVHGPTSARPVIPLLWKQATILILKRKIGEVNIGVD